MDYILINNSKNNKNEIKLASKTNNPANKPYKGSWSKEPKNRKDMIHETLSIFENNRYDRNASLSKTSSKLLS